MKNGRRNTSPGRTDVPVSVGPETKIQQISIRNSGPSGSAGSFPADAAISVLPTMPGFRPRSETAKQTSCFVIMPSGGHGEYLHGSSESEFIFNRIIVPAVRAALGAEVEVIREVDRRQPGAITRDIVYDTAVADIAIVDITGQNPNVFFELGMRYALRRGTTVLLRQKDTVPPFDVHAYRCVEYSPFDEATAQREIAAVVKAAAGPAQRYSDSLVFDVFPELLVQIPGLAPNEEVALDGNMPWSIYWQQLRTIADKLADHLKSGRYAPKAIVGISNGGMMYADLLGRSHFLGIPIVGLWANRIGGNYFRNPFNDSMLQGIKTVTGGDKPIEVLMVDDIVASGTTITQAIEYLESHIPDATVSFLPLFSRNEKYFNQFRDHILWSRYPFSMSEQEVKELHATRWTKLPYDKDIRSA